MTLGALPLHLPKNVKIILRRRIFCAAMGFWGQNAPDIIHKRSYSMKSRHLPAGAILLCLVFILLTGCDGLNPSSADLPTQTTEEEITIDTASTETENQTETEVPLYDPDLYVVIISPEDLMAFGQEVNRNGRRFDGMTVLFLEDLDMGDYTWEPLDGDRLAGVIFDGQGHRVSNLRLADYEYPMDAEPENSRKGCGFIGVATEDLIFRDLTFSHTSVDAYDHSVGNFVGAIHGCTVSFETCRSEGFSANGWMDWFKRDRENGGHAIAMRMGGFVGYLGEDGSVSFRDCVVEDLTLKGFHNLAGFVGYDGAGTLDASDFTKCSVKNADLTFSYCLAENYTVDQPRKFVSVFFNSVDWVDNIDDCAAGGNTYRSITYYDWTDNSAAYTPGNFRSHTRAEANQQFG